MVKYKELYEKEKARYERSEKTGMACPLCLELDIQSELIWYTSGELVCEKEECSFDKTIGNLLEVYYSYKGISTLEIEPEGAEKCGEM